MMWRRRLRDSAAGFSTAWHWSRRLALRPMPLDRWRHMLGAGMRELVVGVGAAGKIWPHSGSAVRLRDGKGPSWGLQTGGADISVKLSRWPDDAGRHGPRVEAPASLR